MTRILLLSSIVAMAGCKKDKDGDNGGTDTCSAGSGFADGSLSSYDVNCTTDKDGNLQFTVDATGMRSFLANATSTPGTYISTRRVVGPSGKAIAQGEDWCCGVYSLSEAFIEVDDLSAFNWPVRDNDPALEDGDYEVTMTVWGVDRDGWFVSKGESPVDVTIHGNRDQNLQDGSVNILIVWTEGTSDLPDVVSATESAVQKWKELWAPHGMDVNVEYIDSTITKDLPYVSDTGDKPEIINASQLADGTQVPVIIGERVGGDQSTLGEAGGIPGPLISTDRSAMVVGWLTGAGNDGVFSEDEVQLYAETLAHEVGHYMGLFHPVEDGFQYWDALDDTEECSSQGQCETQLGSNNMYPYSICDWDSCESQSQVSDDQTGVLQRYTGTN